MFSLLGQFWFTWLPWLLGLIFLKLWRFYKREDFLRKMRGDYTLLELHIPKEVHRSPAAMELIIDLLWYVAGGGGSWKMRLLKGAVLFPASLEIISVEGNIYFFMRVHNRIKETVKTGIYSQYPDIEVHEVDDYVHYVPDYRKHHDRWGLFGSEFKLAKDDFIPIKTYVDYGLDRSVGVLEEHQKIDPITPMLEYLGSLGKGEQMWIQYIVRADIFSDWRKEAQAKIKEMMEKDDGTLARLTAGERELIKAIERSLSKHNFEAVVRAIYLAPKEDFMGHQINHLLNGIFKPFSSKYFNELKPSFLTGFAWKYQNITGKRALYLKKRFFRNYIRREAFYERESKWLNLLHYKKRPDPIILSSEELATLFHIPSTVSQTATLDRIESKKADAPQNLPI